MTKIQSKKEWCGPAAVQSAFRRYGVKHSQKKIAKLGGTDKHGSDQFTIMRAIRALGSHYVEFETDCPNKARRWLQLAYAVPLILCVDRWRHCVVSVRLCRQRVAA